MQRYRILHRTYYSFSGPVQLGPHVLRLRPREDHELRIESSTLRIQPAAALRWHRDVEDNSVAIATFETPASQLVIESDLVIQQFNEAPLDFLVAPEAVDYPFVYVPEDKRGAVALYGALSRRGERPADGMGRDSLEAGRADPDLRTAATSLRQHP